MTEPTGYTALDLVGFTDKGTYNPATPYVKNDLVHYSGDIWRCLIDDTTNITPVEGTNWTVFIEAPTNAIEGIIAPVETNPATNSYAVGRQFIYNDSLYKVITAITAEDTLVAYEDDPSNANIQLADPVETQLLNFEEKAYSTDDSAETTLASDDLVPFYDTSAASKKKMTVANMVGQTVSNPNLLDNPWFTVNQRGFTTKTFSAQQASYSVDRWRIISNSSAGNSTVTLNNGAITVSNDDNQGETYFEQLFENGTFENGRNYTLSVMLSDGTIVKGTNVMPTGNTGDTVKTFITFTGGGFYVYHPANGKYFVTMNRSNGSITIKAVKLELGSASTLVMDTAPNYATELLKCQRYFVRLKNSVIGTSFSGWILNNNARAAIHLPVSMRATPTISTSGNVPWIISDGTFKISTTLAVNTSNNQDITIAESSVFSNVTGNLCILRIDTDAYLDLSADL